MLLSDSGISKDSQVMLNAPPLSGPAVHSPPHGPLEIHIIPLKMIESTHLSCQLLKTKKPF